MKPREQFFPSLNAAGVDSGVLDDLNTAHIVADGQILLSHQAIPGVKMVIEERGDVTIAGITIARDTQIAESGSSLLRPAATCRQPAFQIPYHPGTGRQSRFYCPWFVRQRRYRQA